MKTYTKQQLRDIIKDLEIDLYTVRASRDAILAQVNQKIKELEEGKIIPPLVRVRRISLPAGVYDMIIDPAKLLLCPNFVPVMRRMR